MIGGLADLLRETGAFEEGLGGDAPPEDAGATQRFALDDGDLHAQLGATNGTHVSGGAAAEDDDVERSHGELGQTVWAPERRSGNLTGGAEERRHDGCGARPYRCTALRTPSENTTSTARPPVATVAPERRTKPMSSPVVASRTMAMR